MNLGHSQLPRLILYAMILLLDIQYMKKQNCIKPLTPETSGSFGPQHWSYIFDTAYGKSLKNIKTCM